MALVLTVATVCWLGICLLAVGLCMAAKRGDAALMANPMPLPAPVSARRTRRGGFRGRLAHGA